MKKNFNGQLERPTTELAGGDLLRFTHIETSGNVPTGSQSLYLINNDGTYNFDLNYGLILIEVKYRGKSDFFKLRTCRIDDSVTTNSLTELIKSSSPVTPDTILTIEKILSDAEAARDKSQEYSEDSEDSAIRSEQAAQISATALNIKGRFIPSETSAEAGDVWAYDDALWFALIDTTATPNESSGDWVSLSKHNSLTNRDEAGAHTASAIIGVSAMRNELIRGVVFPEEPEKELQVGDSIPAGVTHVRVQGAIKPLTPQLAGVVNSIGPRSIIINGEEVYHFVVRGGTLFYDESGGKMDATLDQEFWDATAQYARDAGVKIKLGNGQLLLNRFRVQNNTVIGSISTEILLQHNPAFTVVMGQILSNTRLKGLTIKSLEANLEWQRCTFEGASDVTCEWVNFVGFRHASSAPNAWGVYFANSKRCTLIDCGFDDNSQSDFAVVDDNEFISIIRPRRLGGKLVGNIEPNANTPNTQIRVLGAKLDRMDLLSNIRTADTLNRIILEDCEIDTLTYDGADVSLINTSVNNWIESRGTTNTIYAGNIDVVGGNFSFSKNLISDKNFAIAAAGGSNAEWAVSFSTATPSLRLALLSDNHYRGLILNPTAGSFRVLLSNTTPIPVKPNMTYIVGLTASVDTGESWIGGYLRVQEYDGSDQLIRQTNIITHRELAQVTKEVTTNYAIVNTLAQTAKINIQISNGDGGPSTSRLALMAISLNSIGKGDVDFSSIKSEHAPAGNVVVRGASVYKTNFNYRVPMLAGDEVYIGAEHYICTDNSVYNGEHWLGGWEKYSRVTA